MERICKLIMNDALVTSGSTSDYYNKAAAALHMIRKLESDTRFRQLLLAVNKQFYHQTVSTGLKADRNFYVYTRQVKAPEGTAREH